MLVLSGKIEELDLIHHELNEVIQDNPFYVEMKMNLEIVAEEIFVNIIHHGYEKKGGHICFDCYITNNNTLCMQFVDKAPAFNPLAYAESDLTLNAEERKSGGLGIVLVKKIMDDIHYEYTNGSNILSMYKKYHDK
jgi:anti-sigma regulatory factor (Ser/Thr protein kinase)